MTGRTAFESITVCGGASSNLDLVKVFADVFQCKVYQSKVENAAGLGGISMAMFGIWKEANEGSFDDFIKAGELKENDVGEGILPERASNDAQLSDFKELLESFK
jgi:sugar (pentulose or hexulose) kinase